MLGKEALAGHMERVSGRVMVRHTVVAVGIEAVLGIADVEEARLRIEGLDNPVEEGELRNLEDLRSLHNLLEERSSEHQDTDLDGLDRRNNFGLTCLVFVVEVPGCLFE